MASLNKINNANDECCGVVKLFFIASSKLTENKSILLQEISQAMILMYQQLAESVTAEDHMERWEDNGNIKLFYTTSDWRVMEQLFLEAMDTGHPACVVGSQSRVMESVTKTSRLLLILGREGIVVNFAGFEELDILN